jgi:DNA modification methylase
MVLADARRVPLQDGCVQCVVTSPPYFGLRDYGTAKWEGGDPDCGHIEKQSARRDSPGGYHNSRNDRSGQSQPSTQATVLPYRDTCGKCGAIRHDSQIGLEPSPDAYVASLVAVFRELRRVLADDGVCWLNLGDSYAGSYSGASIRPEGGSQRDGAPGFQSKMAGRGMYASRNGLVPAGLKPKDLIGIPWRVAFALQQPYAHNVIRREADRAWLAALVDGEGTMTILQTTSPHGSGDSFPPVLQVRMCDVECIARAAEITGYGKAYPRQDPPSQGGVRGSYQWRLNGSKAAAIAADIYPYLCIKRKQAIIIWNHQKIRDGYETKKGQPVPRAAVEQQRACRELIRKMNRREPVDIPSWMEEPTVEVTPGWYLRSDVIWSKPNPMPESVTDRPTKSHEYVFLLTKSERYFYDAEAIREPNQGGMSGGRQYAQANGLKLEKRNTNGQPDGQGHNMYALDNPAGRNARSVWSIATMPYAGAHFATMPEKLAERCILAGSRPGDLVFDPFGGSGTTVRVARRFNRRGVMLDLNPAYLQLAEERTSELQPMLLELGEETA